jgi:hypothetical protein
MIRLASSVAVHNMRWTRFSSKYIAPKKTAVDEEERREARGEDFHS